MSATVWTLSARILPLLLIWRRLWTNGKRARWRARCCLSWRVAGTVPMSLTRIPSFKKRPCKFNKIERKSWNWNTLWLHWRHLDSKIRSESMGKVSSSRSYNPWKNNTWVVSRQVSLKEIVARRLSINFTDRSLIRATKVISALSVPPFNKHPIWESESCHSKHL